MVTAAETGLDQAPASGAEGLTGEDGEELRSGFTVTLDGFDGPFDLLLGLIAKRKMDVTKVALGEVTDEFIAYVRTLDAQKALDESSNFVFVAATLLDMKLVQLLPGSEVESEEDIAALEARDLLFARLLQYKAFKQIAEQMGQAASQNAGRFPRRPGTHPDMQNLLPELVWNTTAEDLKALAEKAFARQHYEPDHVKLEHLHAHAVNVREEMAAMTEQLRQAGTCRFQDLVAQAENRLVVVVRFLGLLELFRDRAIDFDQDQPLGDLTITWSGSSQEEAAETLARAEEEWDQQ
ncbi:segregation/condensation protein A [Nesterenkonia sp. MY13]|uniref:Segregation and condensation protein A n=1 Tax=Nesterenkonia sedimenti TaxID=1463632 RepID=A0A7X8TGU2_9MICC|nr:ScpA family protein [Nesterenkonia sedimenti]NLS08433.1 segregation/condensation protein A [Nesterenkonia sedimenti]